LKNAGYNAEAFYAKLSTEQKRQVQEGFMAGKIRIICATIAFGLGIDKAGQLTRFLSIYL
jgi:superfamily II DNA helicase RecQ